jgi:acyl-CoA thioesterase-1
MKRWIRLCVAGAIFGMPLACSRATQPAPVCPPSADLNTEKVVASLREPFWASSTMHGETVLFAERRPGAMPTATLLFPPEKLSMVRGANCSAMFQEGRDFVLDKTAGTLTLTAGSRIPSLRLAELYPPLDSPLPKIGPRRDDPSTGLLFSEGHFFHDRQVEITYTHAPATWSGYVPAFAGLSLPHTLRKLRAREPVTLALSGDSISQGYNASGFTGAPPFQPPYAPLVALGLERAWGSKVTCHNFAIAGWQAGDGVSDVARVAAVHPDLVIIAYGMNDSTSRTAAQFGSHIATIMRKIRASTPEAEFVLVSSMLPSAEWALPNLARFPEYQKVLRDLCGPGIVLADLTSVWSELLRRKSFHDLTGNGVNHPNDFGHRLYAQVILGLLTEPTMAR